MELMGWQGRKMGADDFPLAVFFAEDKGGPSV